MITNAVGSVNPHFVESDLVLISDHINMFPQNPLRGSNFYEQGLRFPDMSDVYDKEVLISIRKIAKDIGIKLKEGIYWGWQGPSLETPAEYRMIHRLGADVVGMSSTPEVIMAKYLNMSVSMISIVSNICFPKSAIRKTKIEDIIYAVEKATPNLSVLLKNFF
jgi:purine-nucleoside phosphorylase